MSITHYMKFQFINSWLNSDPVIETFSESFVLFLPPQKLKTTTACSQVSASTLSKKKSLTAEDGSLYIKVLLKQPAGLC